jgi:hypothetical protein
MSPVSSTTVFEGKTVSGKSLGKLMNFKDLGTGKRRLAVSGRPKGLPIRRAVSAFSKAFPKFP